MRFEFLTCCNTGLSLKHWSRWQVPGTLALTTCVPFSPSSGTSSSRLPHSITCIFQQICKIFPSSKPENCFWLLFTRILKSQSYLSAHISWIFCCLSGCAIQLYQKPWDSLFLHVCKYYCVCIFRMSFVIHQNWGFALCIMWNLKKKY